MPHDEFPAGSVWLVGAGPGDPDLLTRKAERLIAAADIVFYDALVGPGILDLIGARAEQISVGKRSGRHSKDQRTIDSLIVAAALEGKRVVRLKGGDPAIFGRTAEEVTACRAAGVTVRICPGITAASAAVASAGTSLTLRGVARRLTLVTAHAQAGATLDLDWPALAATDRRWPSIWAARRRRPWPSNWSPPGAAPTRRCWSWSTPRCPMSESSGAAVLAGLSGRGDQRA
ncbi:hypothetical protein GCM10020258_20960 [Sphingomonas yabuuchiae]